MHPSLQHSASCLNVVPRVHSAERIIWLRVKVNTVYLEPQVCPESSVLQVPQVNPACLAWLQQQIQLVSKLFESKCPAFLTEYIFHLLDHLQLAPSTLDAADWVATKWEPSEHVPIVQSFLSSLKASS